MSLTSFSSSSLVYQGSRLEHLPSSINHPGDESDKSVSSSAATTVLRKSTTNSSDGTSRSPQHAWETTTINPILTNRHALEQHQRRTSMRQTINHTNPMQHFSPFQSSYSGQQVLLTSGDIEAMTMKQFRMGSLGC